MSVEKKYDLSPLDDAIAAVEKGKVTVKPSFWGKLSKPVTESDGVWGNAVQFQVLVQIWAGDLAADPDILNRLVEVLTVTSEGDGKWQRHRLDLPDAVIDHVLTEAWDALESNMKLWSTFERPEGI